MSKQIKVLIVDDSALVRSILSKGLSRDPGILVVGNAGDPYAARDLILEHAPNVLTLDVEMPRMDGVEFLRRLMPQYPIPVVMVSALTERGKQITLDALAAGAVDFVTKPKADVARGLEIMMTELCTKIKIASTANVSHWKHKRNDMPRAPISREALPESTDKVVAIGASTGGTEAVREVICALPPTMPGVVVVQHMPAGFTKLFAERLNSLCAMEVKEAASGDRVMPGRVLIAPGGMQTRLVRSGGIYTVECAPGDLVCGHAPSVEALFQSVARHAASNAIGVILTGMGADGSDGLKAMRDAGARTIGQDEASCVVYGMPKVAFERGGVEQVLPLGDIGAALVNIIRESAK